MDLHVVSMHRGTVLLIPILAMVAGAVRPESHPMPTEQLTLNLVPSGHAQVAAHQVTTPLADARHELSDEELEQKMEQFRKDAATEPDHQPMALVELAETATPQKSRAMAAVRQQMRACNDIAKLARFASSSLLQFRGYEPVEPTVSDLKAQEVNIKGEEYVTEKTCESATDVLRNLINQERHLEVAFMLGTVVATLVAIVCLSIFVGMGLKPPPPGYWKNGSRACCSFSNDFDEEIDVTAELLPVIQKLVDLTTIPEKMGVGRDGDWQTHKKFKVTKVLRIENGKQWTHYANAKKFTPSFIERLQEMPDKLRESTEEAWRNIRSVFEARESDPEIGPFLKSLGLDPTKNETLLFHGSPMAGGRNRKGEIIFPTEAQAPMNAIKKTGFDERLGNVKGMLGSGTYFGDHASKADQYAGRYHEWKDGVDPGSVGEVAAMFLTRVVLGCPYITTQSLEQLRRPPCIKGHFDFQLDFSEVNFGTPWHEKGFELEVCEHPRCDSVIADLVIDGNPKNFREYVLYEKKAYPEFMFLYERLA